MTQNPCALWCSFSSPPFVGLSAKYSTCRDVSLENLMLDSEGVVKLVDFGLALRIPQTPDGAAKVLHPQGPCGKLYYMSPEVLAGSSGFDGFAVDVWACGVVLFMWVHICALHIFFIFVPCLLPWRVLEPPNAYFACVRKLPRRTGTLFIPAASATVMRA